MPSWKDGNATFITHMIGKGTMHKGRQAGAQTYCTSANFGSSFGGLFAQRGDAAETFPSPDDGPAVSGRKKQL